ncbi:MAG: iron-sulfur cluster repair di-iron protein, ric [Clostridiaceae bacterium]|nr:iron-sulfur cluster repair di-iron protein, ric [Clostridiaceae bacterium]
MLKQLTFTQAKEQHLKILSQYVPVVSRVHGGSHPEFYEVQKIFDAINGKIKEAGSIKPELNDEFTKLREITNNYTVPEDVCESYEAVYRMLAEIDKAYYA